MNGKLTLGAVFLAGVCSMCHAQVNYRFTGHIVSLDHVAFDDFAGWEPAKDMLFDGRMSVDLDRLKNWSDLEEVGLYEQVHPLAFEMNFDDFRFFTSSTTIELHNDLKTAPAGFFGGPLQRDTVDLFGVRSCDVTDGTQLGTYSLSLHFAYGDDFLQDVEFSPDLMFSRFEVAGGTVAWAKAGPPFFFVIDSLERIEDSPIADLNGDGVLSAADIDFLQQQKGLAAEYDFDRDLSVTVSDVRIYVHTFFDTHFGDANLDGRFDTSDLVTVFQHGQYEDDIEENSTWETGDWNGDREFSTADMTLAFQDGGFEAVNAAAVRNVNAVPEPTAALMIIACLIGIAIRRRRGVA